MNGLRILITNTTLATRTGTETYVRDLGVRLLDRGHCPMVYSPRHGDIAHEIRAAGILVVDDLAALTVVPDVIHGHHHPETMAALLRFPRVPALFVCHDRHAWSDTPPRFPRIALYVAVDDNCRDRLLVDHALPAERVRVLLNWVDLERFLPRSPLPARPRRALVFSNYASESTYLPAIREACAQSGLPLDVIGAGAGTGCARPEAILGAYDLVFAKARCALEAMAVGAAVVLCGPSGAGALVTAADFDRLRRLNFGMRTQQQPLRPDVLAREIARYDPRDAAEVCRRVRTEAGLERALDELLSLYKLALEERSSASADAEAENRATVAYVHWLASCWHGAKSLENRLLHLEGEHQHLKAAYCHLQGAYEHLRTSYLDGQAAYERLRALYDTRT